MTSQTQDRKLQLVARLLAKAERTTPEEATALTEHAERLMIKYGIEQAMLDARRAQSDQAAEPIVQQRMVLRGVYSRRMRDGLGSVVSALGLKALQASTRGGQVLYVVGFAGDVQQALALMSSLQLQAIVAMRSWWTEHGAAYAGLSENEKTKARGSFIKAFGAGAADRIRTTRAHMVHDAGTGTELVLASRQQAVAEYIAAGHYRKARGCGPVDGYAWRHGYENGTRADTGEKTLEHHGTLAP